MAKPSIPRRLHVHLQSHPKAPAVFQITEARFRSAARRHSAIARYITHSIASDREGFLAGARKAHVLVGSGFPRKNLSDNAPNLLFIHVIAAGIDNLLPLNWLPPGVKLVNNSGVHEPKMREYFSMAVMMLNTRIPMFIDQQQRSVWKQSHSTVIRNKTIAILGVGQMGGAAAHESKKLGMHVLGVRRHGRKHRHVDEMFTPDELHRVLPRADFILVTVPLTSETRDWIGGEEFGLMKQGAGFINLGRASVVDYDCLREALGSGHLSGAVVDVFSPEPVPKKSPLWKTPNLIMTPHVATDDDDHYVPRTFDLLFDNVRRQIGGLPLKNRVRPDLEY